jgi:transposase
VFRDQILRMRSANTPTRSRAPKSRNEATGVERAAQITHVSADAADWIANVVAECCPAAIRCADAFHVVAWATDALDEVRRQAWNDARALARKEPRWGRGRPHAGTPPRPGHQRAQALKRARYALWKNPENITDRQRHKLVWIAQTDPRLYRAYLLKKGLRLVFALKGDAGKEALDRWTSWARRCRIPAFVELQKRSSSTAPRSTPPSTRAWPTR